MPDSWDAVCSCFFIDTARNIVEYLEAIYRILKVGGVWINCGASSLSSSFETAFHERLFRTNPLAL